MWEKESQITAVTAFIVFMVPYLQNYFLYISSDNIPLFDTPEYLSYAALMLRFEYSLAVLHAEPEQTPPFLRRNPYQRLSEIGWAWI